jgi:hypothetical protein
MIRKITFYVLLVFCVPLAVLAGVLEACGNNLHLVCDWLDTKLEKIYYWGTR